MSDTQKRLEQARAELSRIDAEQTAKIDAARNAFEDDPSEAHAGQLAIVERVAGLMIGHAKKAVATIEAEIAEAHRAEIRTELDKLRLKLNHGAVNERVNELAAEQAKIRKQLFESALATATEFDQLYNARVRAEELASQLGETVGGVSVETISNLSASVARVTNQTLHAGVDRTQPRIAFAMNSAQHP